MNFYSWLNIFNILRPNQRPRSRSLTPVAQARENYMRPTVEQLLDAMNKSVTFIVGRNPLERLVSGYRDKILNAISGTDHDRLRRVKNIYLLINGIHDKMQFVDTISEICIPHQLPI